jgi:sodium/proline symporter
LVTFVVYFVLLLGIGCYFYRRSVSIEDYLLGGRRMGAWVTALSAQASDMSGWLLMGLPGAIYLGGMPEVWIAIGLFIGTVMNWKLVSSGSATRPVC